MNFYFKGDNMDIDSSRTIKSKAVETQQGLYDLYFRSYKSIKELSIIFTFNTDIKKLSSNLKAINELSGNHFNNVNVFKIIDSPTTITVQDVIYDKERTYTKEVFCTDMSWFIGKVYFVYPGFEPVPFFNKNSDKLENEKTIIEIDCIVKPDKTHFKKEIFETLNVCITKILSNISLHIESSFDINGFFINIKNLEAVVFTLLCDKDFSIDQYAIVLNFLKSYIKYRVTIAIASKSVDSEDNFIYTDKERKIFANSRFFSTLKHEYDNSSSYIKSKLVTTNAVVWHTLKEMCEKTDTSKLHAKVYENGLAFNIDFRFTQTLDLESYKKEIQTMIFDKESILSSFGKIFQ
jgi:hypothetical protein